MILEEKMDSAMKYIQDMKWRIQVEFFWFVIDTVKIMILYRLQPFRSLSDNRRLMPLPLLTDPNRCLALLSNDQRRSVIVRNIQ